MVDSHSTCVRCNNLWSNNHPNPFCIILLNTILFIQVINKIIEYYRVCDRTSRHLPIWLYPPSYLLVVIQLNWNLSNNWGIMRLLQFSRNTRKCIWCQKWLDVPKHSWFIAPKYLGNFFMMSLASPKLYAWFWLPWGVLLNSKYPIVPCSLLFLTLYLCLVPHTIG